MERAVKEQIENSKVKIVCVNTQRGTGKTKFIINNCLERGHSLIITRNNVQKNHVINQIEKTSYGKGLVNQVEPLIRLCGTESLYSVDVITVEEFKKRIYKKEYYRVFADEVSMLLISNDLLESINIINKIYFIGTFENMEFIDNSQEPVVDINGFYDKQIEYLKEEYAKIEKSNKTVMTRRDILSQIDILLDLKNRDK